MNTIAVGPLDPAAFCVTGGAVVGVANPLHGVDLFEVNFEMVDWLTTLLVRKVVEAERREAIMSNFVSFSTPYPLLQWWCLVFLSMMLVVTLKLLRI